MSVPLIVVTQAAHKGRSSGELPAHRSRPAAFASAGLHREHERGNLRRFAAYLRRKLGHSRNRVASYAATPCGNGTLSRPFPNHGCLDLLTCPTALTFVLNIFFSSSSSSFLLACGIDAKIVAPAAIVL
eukprot:TRINITY_DN15422_c0_g1_i1.p1 TRINITY_DN15422_c0_g1~~TRINITY_DN15422_c0_g1_i1.p1  ORF type:complete len:129 (-),score=9.57 TRINITY_DN15422_c0_g1_i1:8-394(-)